MSTDNSLDISEMSLTEQAAYIVKTAEKFGVEQNFLFITTFKRYQVQINMLSKMEKSIQDEGLVVKKEYVKGRANVYSNPAVKDYNRTADSANGTLQKLLLIIRTLRADNPENTDDPLVRALNGMDGEGEDYDEADDIAELAEAQIAEDEELTTGAGSSKRGGDQRKASKKSTAKK